MVLNFRLGVEVELLAPLGSDRGTLAAVLAHRSGGSVEKFLFPDAEPSKVEGTELFHNLTTGFRVRDGKAPSWRGSSMTSRYRTTSSDLPRRSPAGGGS